MRGTPNEFFSFLPENERRAAIQSFAIIRRCDVVDNDDNTLGHGHGHGHALRFEALIGSWLISRLINILRMDSSALVSGNTNSNSGVTNKSGTGMVGNFNAKDLGVGASSVGDSNNISSNNSVAGQVINDNSSNNSHGNGNGNGNTGMNADAIHTNTNTNTTLEHSDRNDQNHDNNKPLFMYVGHLQSSGAAMNGFATHLAGIISSFSTNNINDKKFKSKGTSSTTTTTTVASTISYCLNLLENSKHKDRLLNGLCSIIIHSHPSTMDSNNNKNNTNNGDSKNDNHQNKNADKDTDTAAIIDVASVSTTNNNDNNNNNNNKANEKGITIPEKARTDLKRIITTALCCILLQVKTSCEAVQDFDYIWECCKDKGRHLSSVFEEDGDEGYNGEGNGNGKSTNQVSKECAWLLSIASYLYFTTSAGVGANAGDVDSNGNASTSDNISHADRRQVRLLLSGACITIVTQSALWLTQRQHQQQQQKNGVNDNHDGRCTSTSRTNVSTRIQLEYDAINQLCMIGQGENDNDNTSINIDATSSSSSKETTKKDDQIYDNNSKEIPMSSSKPSSKSTSKSTTLLKLVVGAINELSPLDKNITSNRLLVELRKVMQFAAKMKLLNNDSDNDNKNDNNIVNKNKMNMDTTFKTLQPIKSRFSTHHDRNSSIDIIGKYCQTLLNSSQNSHSLNGPSIFTGFSFVDETLLVAQDTNYVRLYLIDFNERKSVGNVEHVAAEVQFYRCKVGGEPGMESENEDTIDTGSNTNNMYSESLQQQRALNAKKTVQFNSKMRDTLELNIWTDMVLESSAKRIKPSTKLLFYIGSSNVKSAFSSNRETVGQVMIPAINNALERLSRTGAGEDPKDILKVDKTGGMQGNSQDETSSEINIRAKSIGRSMLSLYYDSLESILDYETARLKKTSHRNLLLSPPFHKALLSICLICVVHATSGSLPVNFQQENDSHASHLFVQSIMTLMDCTTYEYMKVSESFMQSMENSSKSIYHKICRLPKLLRQKLQDTEEHIIESLLWTRCSKTEAMRSTADVLDCLTNYKNKNVSLWPPKVLEPIKGQEISNDDDMNNKNITTHTESLIDDLISESNYVNYLITKLMSLVSNRVAILCGHIGIPPHYPVTKQVWYTFRQFLRKQIHLLYGRHIDQVMLCTIYGVCKVLKYSPELTFSKIIEVYKHCFENRLGKEGAQRVVRKAVLSKNKQGSIIDFYNQIYLPSMKNYLLKSKYIKESALKMKNIKQKRSFQQVEKSISLDDSKEAIKPRKKSKGTIKLQDSNLHLTVTCIDLPNPRKESPKTRVLYSFGDASTMKVSKEISKTSQSIVKLPLSFSIIKSFIYSRILT
jgi:hypothetical protein